MNLKVSGAGLVGLRGRARNQHEETHPSLLRPVLLPLVAYLTPIICFVPHPQEKLLEMLKRNCLPSICIFGSFVLLSNVFYSMTHEFLENNSRSLAQTRERSLTDSANHIEPAIDKMAHPWHSSPEIQPISHSRVSDSQKRAQRFLAIEDVLFKWDQKHQDFLKELSDPQTGSSTGNFKNLLQGIGSHYIPGLQKTKIQYTEEFQNVVARADKAEEARAKALQNYLDDRYDLLRAYLYGRTGIESHFKDLLLSFAPDWNIGTMEINGKSAVELVFDVVIEVNKRRHDFNQHFSTTHKPVTGYDAQNKNMPSMREYLEKEFDAYSRLLLLILVQGWRRYQWDLSGFPSPKMWLSSLLFNEIYVISERMSPLKNLELGEVEKAEKHFMEATKTQASTYELRRNLHAMGLSTLDIEKDLRYQKLHDQLKLNQRNFVSISPEAMEVNLEKLTTQRVMLENHFTMRASIDSKEPPISSHLVLTEEESQKMSCLKDELVEYAVNAFKNELKAQKEFLEGLSVEAQSSFMKSAHMQEEAYDSKIKWITRKYSNFNLNKEEDYANLKEAEKEILAREARRKMMEISRRSSVE